ncbi:glycosyltransferase [Mesorhizobium sp. M7A.F.Ca.US.006.04.2.1]|uniref:glycosyltransferase family 2 protein n=2 Tax=Mesorhizobium TaxID=68287 RepID=UPI0007ED78DD|nr:MULTISPECIES: glycosyltransferase family 2 protein [unclassified Mesorhizobium]RVA38462.1 glycosyltransferase [Mesorhizobium sp. M7A.F.Ca.US.001.01.1.1]ARP63601.1 sugar transferase [Mesorhizobium sp. WSM1497]MBZ9891376.1 glycosyltransferase family 2 protein [Mesorhizobium sp. BR1-1-3]RUX70905.1 glycosyltransferase [Mesorhizobium sp. M7A.F.Ca.US.005.03.1.1]RUY28602.1 glycosyltransferase [Mesorhizobium sp. M7A.F.Ca.US.001.04.2.1]
MVELRPSLDIVAPFFNEAASASAFACLLGELEVAVAQRFGMTVHKILVDDGSRDDGAVRFSQALTGSWEIVRLSRNFGKEVAVLAGLDQSRGDMVLIMDADLQHSLDISLKLIAELVDHPDIDVVYAQNDRREASWRRSQLARLFYSLINSSQRFDIPENAGDFRVMRGAVARALTSLRDKRRFNKGLFAWAGFRQKALPYSPEGRASGTSKWSRLNLIAFSLEGFTSFSVIPLRLISLSGLLAALAGALYGAKVLFEVIFYGIAVPGYPSLLVAVVLLGGLNLTLLGLIGEYVWVTLSESKDRPVYLVRDVVRSVAPADRPEPGTSNR